MNVVNGTSGQNYLDYVQQATQRNTLNHVVEAKQSATEVDTEQLQSSNQALKDNARETAAGLYSQQVQKQTFETYVNTSVNNLYNTESDDDDNSSAVYTFDAARVNDAQQTVQQRTFAVSHYENQSQNESENQGQNENNYSEFNQPSTRPVNVYV